MSKSSKYTSIRITHDLMVAIADGDLEAKAIQETWKPKFNVITLDKEDPSLNRVVTFA